MSVKKYIHLICTHCGSNAHGEPKLTFFMSKRFTCSNCGMAFDAPTGKFIRAILWIYLLWMIGLVISFYSTINEIERHAGHSDVDFKQFTLDAWPLNLISTLFLIAAVKDINLLRAQSAARNRPSQDQQKETLKADQSQTLRGRSVASLGNSNALFKSLGNSELRKFKRPFQADRPRG
jgi:hypothetical protein